MLDPDDVVRSLAVACQQREIDALRAALDGHALGVCDSAGLLPGMPDTVQGPNAVAQLLATLCWQPDTEVTIEAVNGQPGLAVRCAGRAVAVIDVLVAEQVVLWIVINPAKLNAWHHR